MFNCMPVNGGKMVCRLLTFGMLIYILFLFEVLTGGRHQEKGEKAKLQMKPN